MSLAALLQRRTVTPVTSSTTTDVTAPGRAITEGYAGYVGYAENGKGETKTDDAPLKACAPSAIGCLFVDENRQRRTIEKAVSGVTGVPANDDPVEPESSIERLERLHEETGRMIESALRDAKIRANAEAIGDDLEARLIEGAEALAKIRPDTDPAPLATASYGEVVAWMDASGETDPETRREILVGYGFDPSFQYPDSGRRTCRQCRNLDADGGCRAARRGQIPNTSRFYTYPPGIDAPHRCVGYLPGPDDADRRPGRERFDWLLKMVEGRRHD